MSEAGCALFLGNLNHFRHNQRARKTRTYRILSLVERVCFDGWKNIVSCEFFSGVDRVVFENSEFASFPLDFFQVFLLPNVDCDGYDLGLVFFLEPLDEYGCVESA